MYPNCGRYLHTFGFGGKGIRTPDLLIANETLYQLSYTPPKSEKDYRVAHDFHQALSVGIWVAPES